jgi:hypothetical protein
LDTAIIKTVTYTTIRLYKNTVFQMGMIIQSVTTMNSKLMIIAFTLPPVVSLFYIGSPVEDCAFRFRY